MSLKEKKCLKDESSIHTQKLKHKYSHINALRVVVCASIQTFGLYGETDESVRLHEKDESERQ